jgi:SAM-dependent methyltransferase
MPDIQARLRPAIRRLGVADLGCGSGWSSIALSRAYPAARIDGLDLDESSVADARRTADRVGVADRVRFDCRDAGDPALAGRYVLAMFFETLHDMADPVSALRAARALLVPGGEPLAATDRHWSAACTAFWNPTRRGVHKEAARPLNTAHDRTRVRARHLGTPSAGGLQALAVRRLVCGGLQRRVLPQVSGHVLDLYQFRQLHQHRGKR